MIRRKARTKAKRQNLKTYSIPTRVTVLALTILALAIPVVIYFTRYISNQTAYFTNQNFRELVGISEQLELRATHLRELFEGAVKEGLDPIHKADPLGTFQRKLQDTGLSPVATQDNSPIPTGSKSYRAKMEIVTGGEDSILRLISDVKAFTAEEPLSEIMGPLVEKRGVESTHGSDHEQGFDAILVASLHYEYNKNAADVKVHSKVIFQSRSPELDIDSLDNLVRSDAPDKTVDLNTFIANTALAEVKLANENYAIYAQPIELPITTVDENSPTGAANERSESRWIVCGLVKSAHFRRQTWAFPYTPLIIVAFMVVLVALSWPFLKLVFIGPKDRFRLADVYLIAFAFLIGSAVLTFFTLYGLTYTQSEHEMDAQLRELSRTIAGYGDESCPHHFCEGSLQKEIAAISSELDLVTDRLTKTSKPKSLSPGSLLEQVENKRAPDQRTRRHDLTSYDRTYILSNEGTPGDDLVAGERRRANNDSGTATSGKNDVSDTDSNQELRNSNYPYFQRVAWVDNTGTMQVLWSTTKDTSRISVGNRDWVRKIIEGKSRDLPEQPIWLEPLTSRYTGNRAAVVSKPIYSSKDPAKIVGVVGIDPNLMSLMQTVLPAGFGYRVIDASGNDPGDDENDNNPGKVVFQSSESQTLKENFFQECDNNHSLRSLVFGRASDFVEVYYKGEGHRLYVAPIKGFPNWSLIVFRNKQPLRTVYLEILTMAAFLFFLYAGVLLVVFTVFYIIKTRTNERTEWIWPSKQMSPVYRQTFYANLFLCLLSLIVIVLPRFQKAPGILILLVSCLGFSGILVLALRLKLSWILNRVHLTVKWLEVDRLVDRGGGPYVWNMVILLVLTGILPAVGFFKVAFNEEMMFFVKHGQFTLSQGLEQRRARIDTQYSAQRSDPSSNPSPIKNVENANTFIDRRWQDSRDVYDHFFFATERILSPEMPAAKDSALVLLNSYLPFFNETSIQMGGLTHAQADDLSFRWEEDEFDNLAFHTGLDGTGRPVDVTAESGKQSVHLITPLPRFGSLSSVGSRANLGFRGAWIVSFALILVLMFLLARMAVRRVFLLHISDGLDVPKPAEIDIGQNLFIVRDLPAAANNRFLGGQQFFPVDLAVDALADDWRARIEAQLRATPKDKVIIHHFEYRSDKPEFNKQKLGLLESLLGSHKVIVVVSALEPAAYSSNGAVGSNGIHTNDDQNISERWACVLSHFRKLYSGTTMLGISEAALSTLQDNCRSTSSEKRNQVLELASQVYEECAPLPCLQQLCNGIISRLPSEEMGWNQIRREIFDRAELHYRQIVDHCTDGERLTLLHLAQDRLLSPNDPDIGVLLRKRLIIFTPDLRLMNETFKQFLLLRPDNQKLEARETEARKASPWEVFKVPLFIGFAGVILFLVFTQKDLYNSSWTILTAMTTGIPAVIKVISMFRSGSAGEVSS